MRWPACNSPSTPATPVRSKQMLGELAAFEVDPGLAAAKSYQLAYGDWKLAQLLAEPADDRARSSSKASAGKAAKSCVQHAREAIEKEPRMADSYAIEAVCDTFSPGPLGSASCTRSKSMRTALTLGAENPRVQFINALCSARRRGRSGCPGSLAQCGREVRSRAAVAARQARLGSCRSIDTIGSELLEARRDGGGARCAGKSAGACARLSTGAKAVADGSQSSSLTGGPRLFRLSS